MPTDSTKAVRNDARRHQERRGMICKCAICEGTGRLYKASGKPSPRGNVFAVSCHGCNGRGQVETFGTQPQPLRPKLLGKTKLLRLARERLED